MVYWPLTLTAVRAETPELVHLELTAPPEFLEAYTVPGQYVQIQFGEMKPGFFAIAIAPQLSRKAARIELLIKRGSPLTNALVALSAGEIVQVSTPQGRGFPIAASAAQDIYLIGVGSGIAPLRALLQEIISRRQDFGKVEFLYGARTGQAIPYPAECEVWSAANIEVTHVCSQPMQGSWQGATGHVQDVLRLRRNQGSEAPTISAQSAVYVCGPKPMVEDLKTLLPELGLDARRIFQNF